MVKQLLLQSLLFLYPMWASNVVLNLWYFLRIKFNLWDYSLDLNKNFVDGNRLFGDSKTVLGLPITLFVGYLCGLTLATPLKGMLLGSCVFFGALVSGFIKRRLNLKRGRPFPVVDQTDYLFFAYLVFFGLGKPYNIEVFGMAFLLTGIIHHAANVFAYKVGIKEVPW